MFQHPIIASRLIPASIIAIALALGCGTPPRSQYDISGAPADLHVRYQNKLDEAVIPADPTQLMVVPLGIRPREQGMYVDVMLLGKPAPRVATILNEQLRGPQLLNSLVAIRALSPDPGPLRLSWDTRESLLVGEDALFGRGSWQPRQTSLTTTPRPLVIAIPLRSDPFLSDGRYELRLLVPTEQGKFIADLRDLNVIIHETPILNDIRRIKR